MPCTACTVTWFGSKLCEEQRLQALPSPVAAGPGGRSCAATPTRPPRGPAAGGAWALGAPTPHSLRTAVKSCMDGRRLSRAGCCLHCATTDWGAHSRT